MCASGVTRRAVESERGWRGAEANSHDLNFINLDGNIACLVNGAGERASVRVSESEREREGWMEGEKSLIE